MQSILEILDKCAEYFASKGIPDAKTDAQLLLAHALGCKRLELFLRFDEPMTETKLAPFREMVKRRARREPLQHIIGTVDFFGLKLKCDARALIPRPETETLCEIITRDIFADAGAKIRILDLGTGSGAIALALASHYANSEVEGIDSSLCAISLAEENLRLNESLSNRVKIYFSDWFEKVVGTFDIIVSNPPYLSDAEVASSQAEVCKFDPLSALRSDENGLADIKQIVLNSPSRLKSGGFLVCECGLNQTDYLSKLALESGFSESHSLPDLSRRQRFLICKL